MAPDGPRTRYGSGGFSIRYRITALAGVLLLVAAAVLFVFIRDYAERAADRAFDRLLAASALSIAGAVQIEDGEVTLELPYAAFAMFSGDDRVFYSVRAPDGSFVTGYDDLATALPLAESLDPVFEDIDYRGDVLRIASLGRLVSTAETTGYVTIRVAETQGAREALSREIVGNALVPLVVLTLLAGFLVWYLIRRTFEPLTSLEHELRTRRQDDLSPIEVPVPAEVRHLVGALNGFMGRLKVSMDRLSELVAEAAHQVRTPLASLRAQTEVAMDEQDPEAIRTRIGRIHQAAVQSSQLVTQLLMDATISHRIDRNERERIPLEALVDDVVRRLDPDALSRLAVTMPPEAGSAEIVADRVVMREMLKNLLENALAYSEQDVELIIETIKGEALVLKVLDRGPGIADEEKALVLERFRRGSRTEDRPGSGLGLAIVKRAVEAQAGRLDLSDRPGGGLKVTVRLPLPQGQGPAKRWTNPAAALCLIVFAGLLLLSRPAAAAPILYEAPSPATGEPAVVLDIVGTTDTELFAYFIRGYQRANPSVAVRYDETDTLPMYEDYLAGRLTMAPDVLMSSASDLQVKLANDGHVLPHQPQRAASLPRWAGWRSEVFGFTLEPAVIVYNPDLVSAEEAPRTHTELIDLLEAQPERFRRKVATYDIAASGVGYLLAVQDQLISTQFWRLAAALGRTDAVLSGSSPEILDRIAAGDLALGYNVLGSYAFARQAAGANLRVIVPDDYVLILTRSLVIPHDAPDPDLARSFIDFVLSPEGQAIAAGPTALGAIIPGTRGLWTSENILELGRGAAQPIALGPALLVALDQQRRSRFLDAWRGIIAPE